MMKKLIQKIFGTKPAEEPNQVVEVPSAPKSKKPRIRKVAQAKVLSDKEKATAAREPYINITSIELDPSDIGNGAFELDWNEFFIANLVKAGYRGKDDAQMVDQWFQNICRNVVMETFEQYEANNPRPATGIQRRDLGDGKTEVS
jgi:hypothetical protein